MPLVRLEVENFKSYRGKQIIGPFYSFSAISEFHYPVYPPRRSSIDAQCSLQLVPMEAERVI